jgi:hypothetical protein
MSNIRLDFEVVEHVPSRNEWLVNQIPVNKIFLAVRGPNPMTGMYTGVAHYPEWDGYVTQKPLRYWYVRRKGNMTQLVKRRSKIDNPEYFPCDIVIKKTREVQALTPKEVADQLVKNFKESISMKLAEIYDNRGLPTVSVSTILALNEAITKASRNQLGTGSDEPAEGEDHTTLQDILHPPSREARERAMERLRAQQGTE